MMDDKLWEQAMAGFMEHGFNSASDYYRHLMQRKLENNPGSVSYVKDIPGKDPWANRKQRMLCMTCMFYVPKVALIPSLANSRKLIEKKGPIGRCRRHAPTMGGYPAVFDDDWCGDHKLDENKV